MEPQTRKTDRYQAIEQYAAWLLREMQNEGIKLSVVGENGLQVKGEMTVEQRENIRIWKRHLIDALSLKCSNCTLPMKLIENGTLWFCPFGCESRANILKSN
jgi:hypothetical protein